MTKSAVSCVSDHILLKKPLLENFIFCAVITIFNSNTTFYPLFNFQIFKISGYTGTVSSARKSDGYCCFSCRIFEGVSKTSAAQKMMFSIKDFFSKCDQICRKQRIWSHLLKKSLIGNFIFGVVSASILRYINSNQSKKVIL